MDQATNRVASCLACLVLTAAALAACNPSNESATDGGSLGVTDRGNGGSEDGGAPGTSDDAGVVLSITVSPLTLSPPFGPGIQDYYVRCAAGPNSVTITVTSTTGVHATAAALTENQLIEPAPGYWLRCLPSDFPVVTVTTYPDAGSPTPGWYLATNTVIAADAGSYAMVLDTNGTPVWYQSGNSAIDLDSPATNTLSLMDNADGDFETTAVWSIEALGASTTTVSAVGTPTDEHELQLLPNGDHLLFSYIVEQGIDLEGLEGFTGDETMADCQIQEVSPSGALVWSWLASDHIDPVQESIEPLVVPDGDTDVVDVFHCNSIDVDASGNLLLSVREANAAYYIDKSSGVILWKLGGTSYNKDGAALIQVVNDPQATFNMQHDVRFQAGGNVSMFDDHGAVVGSGVARGVEYALDADAGTATIAFEFLGIQQSQYMGSFRRYADGESVIGWGNATPDPRAVTEMNASGADVLDIAFPGGNTTYRAIKVPIAQLDAMTLRTAAGQ